MSMSLAGTAWADAREDLNHVSDALDRAEVREVHKEGLAGLRVTGAHGSNEIRPCDVNVTVDEVSDHFNRVGCGEGLVGSVGQIRADCSDTVRLINAELGDGEIGAIEADQRDIRAVQRRDEGEMDAAGSQHLLGQVRADAVRNGVVNMQKIERVKLGHFCHAGGESEVVRRMLEKRVVKKLHLMEVDIGLATGEAEGRR